MFGDVNDLRKSNTLTSKSALYILVNSNSKFEGDHEASIGEFAEFNQIIIGVIQYYTLPHVDIIGGGVEVGGPSWKIIAVGRYNQYSIYLFTQHSNDIPPCGTWLSNYA